MDTAARPVRVLVVEDDEEIAQVLQRSLRLEGYEVKLAGDGVQGLEEAHAFLPDLIVLDLGLPRLDGVDVAKRLREDGDEVPILMLTARDAVETRVEGLDSGADDYLVKPFAIAELNARLRAVLRREVRGVSSLLTLGAVRLDTARHLAHRGARELRLTLKEFAVLRYLLSRPGHLVSSEELLEHVWDENADPFTQTVRVTVGTLRRKLTVDGEPQLLETVTGRGYRLREETLIAASA
jgi:DNA-binding response OmpR family regulator